MVDFLLKKNYHIIFLSQSLHTDDQNANDHAFVEPFLTHPDVSATKSIQETLATYKNLNFVIGMRLHSLILSVVHTIPFLAISYETKTRELLKDLEYTHFLEAKNFDFQTFKTVFLELESSTNDVKFALQQKNDTITADLQKKIDTLLEKII